MTENTTTDTKATPDTSERREDDRPIRIVILQRGWVMVGRFDYEDADMCALHDAAVVRRWGTNRGLGQIASNGPRATTVLDPVGTVRFHVLTTIAVLDADYEKWTKVLGSGK